MGRLSFASRMILSYFLAVLLTAGVLDYFLVRRIHESGMEDRRADLRRAAELIEPYFNQLSLSAANQRAWDAKLTELSASTELRIALYDRTGAKLASSEKSMPAGDFAPPHDVALALEEGQGFEERDGARDDANLYYAKKVAGGVLEVALPTASANRGIDGFRTIFWLGVFAWMLLSLALSRIYFARLERVLSRWRRVVKKFGKADAGGTSSFANIDEMEKMGLWINQMSTGLEKKITELTGERNQLRTILDTMQEGVLVFDAEGNIQDMNPIAGELLGIGHSALGRPPIEAVRNPDLQEIVDEALAGRSAQRREIRILHEGRELFLLVHATPFRGEGPSGAIVAFFDITPIRKLERVRRDFVANVSHEIKTPLTSIQGYVETLLDGALQDPEAAKNFLKVIEANSRRLSKLVDDLLRLSEIESQKVTLHDEPILLKDLFEEVVALQEVQLKKKNSRVETVYGVERFVSDHNALLHILSNLLENAVKYGSSGQLIRLAAIWKDGRVLISVSDEGIGIAPEHIDRIFERFYRVDPSRSRSEGGTGLGLAIVKHLVQLLGGEVWAESRYGSGTTFFFTVPESGAGREPISS